MSRRAKLTEKQIIRVRAETPNSEYLQQVKELAMDIPYHSDRCFDVHDIALLHQQLLSLRTDGLDDRLGQEFLAVESLDAFVQVNGG